MKKRSFPWHLLALVLLIAAAFASAAFAVKPLVYNAEKTQEIKRENRQFYLNAEALKEILWKAGFRAVCLYSGTTLNAAKEDDQRWHIAATNPVK